ncbi:cupin-like domain-containing protein [Microbulbifer halophilus]|uniref:Cupin-like domain-containing protein n=1 Tax=Microbulbifer halophilus TaxID=453963 RepID=A0ABW5E7H7_9GAMM|nr:cupin-like domain-containing protein [Microbulbifer halophilus]MCW8125855.1 cupin-like domain-containing protein [Microbulbifer halophilus]
MVEITKKTKAIEGVNPDNIPWQRLMEECEPVVLKGIAKDWELVRAGRQSAEKAMGYLKSFHNGKTVCAYLGPAEIKGKYFYKDDLSGLNFESQRLPLDKVLDRIGEHLESANPPSIYVGSTTLDACLPGLREYNDLVFDDAMFESGAPLTSIWVGNRSIASAHYDAPNNLACCVVGRRRFTLFPPDQIDNLYPGPLEPTPGGQAVSMVDFADPDFDRYPRFRKALAAAQVADLEPGDAVFYPSLWWHQVEALSPFNVLVNYWWNTSPLYMGTPMNALYHALLSLRDRPDHEREGWKHIFDYYIFGDRERPRTHLPEKVQGALGPVDDTMARQLRAMLLHKLNR